MSKKIAKQSGAKGAPLTRAGSQRQGQPTLKSLPKGRLLVSHSEVVNHLTAVSSAKVWSRKLTPKIAPILGNLARNFQSYQFRKVRFRYVPRQGATASGNVSFGVVYTHQSPFNRADQDASNDWGNLADEVKSLVGSVSLPPGGAPAMAGNIAKVVVENFTRKLFQMVLPWAVTRSPDMGTSGDNPATVPGHLCIALEPGSVTAGEALGDLYMDYEVEFESPIDNKFGGDYLQIYSNSSDDAALGLGSPHLASGHLNEFGAEGNSIYVYSAGIYDVLVDQRGTSLNANAAGLTVSDVHGTSRTDAALGSKYDAGLLEYQNVAQVGSTINLESTTQCVYHARLQLNEGDKITIPSLSTGSLTSTSIMVMSAPRIPVIVQT